jgi:tRNA U34 5-carboxymethylaminomethyl modifying GTPase MnmE/TrmE
MYSEILTKKTVLLDELRDSIGKLSDASSEDTNAIDARILAENLHSKLSEPLKIALGGEFSSGKSTLTKMLLGEHVVETQAAANAAPTVIFKYSSEPGSFICFDDKKKQIPDFEALTESELRDANCIEIHLDLPFLKHFEIYDTPGTSDPTRDVDQLVEIADQVDKIIWCTNATQAWRESERRMWANLPNEIKQQSTLVVTHVDLPNVKASLDRLLKRLTKEAGPLFREIIPMDIPSAIDARAPSGEILDESEWASSGGAACLEAITHIADEVSSEAVKLVAQNLADTIGPAIENMVVAAEPQENTFIAFWDRWVSEINDEANTDIEPAFVAQRYINLLAESERNISEDKTIPETFAEEVRSRLAEARDFLKLEFRNCETHKRTKLARQVIDQLNLEINHLNSFA